MSPQRRSAQSGVAILTVLVSMAILTILAFELAFSTGVQSRLARTFHEGAQAKYLAKTALNLSLLRVYMYLNLLNMMSEVTLPLGPEALSQVYSVPLPPFPFDDAILAMFPVAVRIGLEKFATESVMGKMTRAKFASDIRGLSGKLPLNFLDGEPERYSSKKFQKLFSAIITKIIADRMENDEKFYDRYQQYLPEELAAGLIDYIDLDTVEQSTGQLEEIYFQQFVPPEFLRHRRYAFMEELALAKRWDDTLVQKFGNLFNLHAFYPFVDVNQAPSEVLKILFAGAEKEQMEALQEKITTQAFKNYEEVEEFRKLQDIRFEGDGENPYQKILSYHERVAFKINSQGIVGDTTQEYTTIIVLKPDEKQLKQINRDIRRMVTNNQQKIEKFGDIEDPEFEAFMEDPFNFFELEEDKEIEEETVTEAADDSEKADSKKKDAKKRTKKEKKIRIFDEPPAQFEIAYWGDPV